MGRFRTETFGAIKTIHGDSAEALKTLADASVDSVVTDPPYALVSIGKRFGADNAAPAKSGKSGAYARASAGFMGQKWDTGETAFAVEFWQEVLRVLKPGGHVLAFGGTRTYHRLVCAIEDACFEIRDQIAWLYGSGFPKSHNVREEGWEGWGTALKPALEPIVVARKPIVGTVAANVLAFGTGALNIDASRVEGDGKARPINGYRCGEPTSVSIAARADFEPRMTNEGRWPANVIHDGSEEVVDRFPVTASGAMKAGTRRAAQDGPGSVCYGTYGGDATAADTPGSAARFFYSAKADAEDRLGSKHPTVKPVDLMAYLCRLVTPPGGTVLDPFAGSGSTGVACVGGGFAAILIEREETYFADIGRRIAWAQGRGRLTAQEIASSKQTSPDDLPLFSEQSA